MALKAEEAFRLLHGVICAYKPPGASPRYVISKLKTNICRDLNNLEKRPAKIHDEIIESDDKVNIIIRPRYSDHELCSGPKYKENRIFLHFLSGLSDLCSGVMPLCINDGGRLSLVLKRLNFTKCFHIKGILGQATDNYQSNGKVIFKANYNKVDRDKFEKILASYQSATQRKLFEEYGFHLQSQEAYDFAVKGLYRPTFKGPPIIYAIKMVDFYPPKFTLEIQCIHETEQHLLHLIHNLGLNLKCYASCVGIRCIRYGCFHAEHSLVKEDWTLQNILENTKICWDVLEKHYSDKIKFSVTVNTREKTSQLAKS